MSHILCQWLNNDLSLGKTITDDNIADDFANGYLFGKILHAHGLQDDFSSFSKGKSSEAKLNNFMRLEPSMRRLNITFKSNRAHDIMSGRPNAAIGLIYHLYVALGKMKQSQLTGQAVGRTRSLAKVKLEKKESEFYVHHLKQKTPRQVDLTFQELTEKFEEKRRQREELIKKQELADEERIASERRRACHESMDKQRAIRTKRAEMYTKLKPIELPTTSPKTKSAKSSTKKKKPKLTPEALEVQADIAAFEASLKHKSSSSAAPLASSISESSFFEKPNREKVFPDDYMLDIKKRVKEGKTARTTRDMRRRKVLLDQMTAIEEQSNRNREDFLAQRLTRQCLQEKRISTQLMHVRKEKENIRNNIILRQKQYEEEREKEFQEALDREATEAKRECEEQQLMLKAQQDKKRQLFQERAKENYQKHYNICHNILHQIVDFSIKIGDYKKITQDLIPAKMVREWKILFLSGKPLFDDTEHIDFEDSSSSSSDGSDKKEPDDILDETDIQDYLQSINEWSSGESIDLLSSPNMILTHIVHRLIDIVTPTKPSLDLPLLPKFYLKGAFLGLPFTGKSTILEYLHINYDIHVIDPSSIVSKATETYKNEIAPSLPETEGEGEEESKVEGEGDLKPTVSVTVVNETEISTELVNKESEEISVKVEETPVELSPLGVLGERAFKATNNGNPVDDMTLVDIIVHEIKSLPDGTGWILDNFPTTIEQAQLLACGLTGQGANALKEQSIAAEMHPHRFLLIPDREVKEEEVLKLQAVCGLDLVINFDATHDTVFRRSVLNKEDTPEKPDIQQCLLTYDANWPKLKKWYYRYRALTIINADQELEQLYSNVQKIIEEHLTKAKQKETMKKLGLKTSQHGLTGLITKSVSRMANMPTVDEKPVMSPIKRKRRPSSAGSSPMPKFTSVGAIGTPSRNNSVQSPLHVTSAESELFQLLEVTTEPGEEGWNYCSLPVYPELVPTLSQRWPEAEKIYKQVLHDVFRSLREERDLICHYVYDRRTEFSEILKKPDNKQEIVRGFQKSFNDISADLRSEDTMKAELHLRVEELCDELWAVCDSNKIEFEEEKRSIIEDQWLQDHVGLLSNHYISLMQAELGKFQDVVVLFKEYYASMTDCQLKSSPDLPRLPIIELPLSSKKPRSSSAMGSKENLTETQGEENAQEELTEKDELPLEESYSVPMIPREPPSIPETTHHDEKTKRKSTADPPPLVHQPPPLEDLSGLDLDSQLITHVYNMAMTIAYNLMCSELQLIQEATAEANKSPEISTPPVQETKEEKSSGKGGKKEKGAKSPSGKKGKATPSKGKGGKGQAEPEPVETPVHTSTPSPSQLAKKQKLELMRREHTAALKYEEKILMNRLVLIKTKALEFVNQLKDQVMTLYKEMDQWTGECYKHEVQSVNQLAEVLRYHIEEESKLLYELTLPGVDFKINQGIYMYPPSPSKSPPRPIEPIHSVQFTSHQLLALLGRLRLLAPNGTIITESFIDLICELSNKTYGENVFPSLWMWLSEEQARELIEMVYSKNQIIVNWSRLVLCLAQPFPLPTIEDLLSAQELFKAIHPERIDWNSFDNVSLWLDKRAESNRDKRLKQVMFELFREPKKDYVNYSQMLLYLCASPDPLEGFLKALSLTTGAVVSLDSEIEVNVQALHMVLSHSLVSEEICGLERMFANIGGEHTTSLPLVTLLQHPPIIELAEMYLQYNLPDVSVLATTRPVESTELSSSPSPPPPPPPEDT